MRETLDVLNRVFRFRPCEGPRPGRHSGFPCLDYHIDRCFAPCIGAISKEDYGRIIEGVIGFVSGDTVSIQRELDGADARGGGGRALRRGGSNRNRLNSIRHLSDVRPRTGGRSEAST